VPDPSGATKLPAVAFSLVDIPLLADQVRPVSR
jgi:hypothetical protein